MCETNEAIIKIKANDTKLCHSVINEDEKLLSENPVSSFDTTELSPSLANSVGSPEKEVGNDCLQDSRPDSNIVKTPEDSKNIMISDYDNYNKTEDISKENMLAGVGKGVQA